MRDRLGLAATTGDPGPDLRVRALDLVGDGLADVVQQRRPAGGGHGGVQLRGDQPREL